jgi:hypothetical protein
LLTLALLALGLPAYVAAFPLKWQLAVDSQLDNEDWSYSSPWWQTTQPRGFKGSNRALSPFYNVNVKLVKVQIESLLSKTKSYVFSVDAPVDGKLTLRDLVNSGGFHFGMQLWRGKKIRPYGIECMPTTDLGGPAELAPGPCGAPVPTICSPMSANYVVGHEAQNPVHSYPHTSFLRSRLGFNVCHRGAGTIEIPSSTAKDCFTTGIGLSLTGSGVVNAKHYKFAKAKVWVSGPPAPSKTSGASWKIAIASMQPAKDFMYDSSWWFAHTAKRHGINALTKAYFSAKSRRLLFISNGKAQLALLRAPSTLRTAVGRGRGAWTIDPSYKPRVKSDAFDALKSTGGNKSARARESLRA